MTKRLLWIVVCGLFSGGLLASAHAAHNRPDADSFLNPAYGLIPGPVDKLGLGGSDDVGNGGDSVEIDIRNRARLIADCLDVMEFECTRDLAISGIEMLTLLRFAKIEITERILYVNVDGKDFYKEAINYPRRNLIVFNRHNYLASDHRDQLIVHEFLGLHGVADVDYEESRKIIEAVADLRCRMGRF